MEAIKRQNNKSQFLNTLETDLKGETVAATLALTNDNPEQVILLRKRGDKRNVSKDVEALEQIYSGYDMLEYIYIHVNRNSIYDTLPEGIFHRPQSNRKPRYKEDIIEEIKSQRLEESFARKFFQPFEMAVDQLLVQAQIYEQKYDKAFFYTELKDLCQNQWNVLKHMSLRQALLFIKIIPVVSEVSRSFELISKVMSIILEFPVSVTEGEKSAHKLEQEDITLLHNWKLGINSITGASIDSDMHDLDIVIGPIDYKQAKLFSFDERYQHILKGLIDMLIPFDRYVNIKYKIDRANAKFRLSSENHKAYLGINTLL